MIEVPLIPQTTYYKEEEFVKLFEDRDTFAFPTKTIIISGTNKTLTVEVAYANSSDKSIRALFRDILLPLGKELSEPIHCTTKLTIHADIYRPVLVLTFTDERRISVKKAEMLVTNSINLRSRLSKSKTLTVAPNQALVFTDIGPVRRFWIRSAKTDAKYIERLQNYLQSWSDQEVSINLLQSKTVETLHYEKVLGLRTDNGFTITYSRKLTPEERFAQLQIK